MEKTIRHNHFITKVQVPASKSYAQRVILTGCLSNQQFEILNAGQSEDVLNCIKVAKNLGAQVIIDEDGIKMQGLMQSPKSVVNVGESGLGGRLTALIGAVLTNSLEVDGAGSLLNRSMAPFQTILPQLNKTVQLNDQFFPLSMKGTAKGGNLEIDGSTSSQYLSGLLIALPYLTADSKITVKNLISRPYIDITLEVLEAFNIEIKRNQDEFIIPGGQIYSPPASYIIEGDYSAASIWMVHGAINQGITISGLNKISKQGDKQMLVALQNAGVKFSWTNQKLQIEPSKINPFRFDATECPDLFPALVVLAAAAIGNSQIRGANRLIHKESNRAAVLKNEFGKLGIDISIEGDTMKIVGTGILNSGIINSNNDHRIAMAGAIAASLTQGEILIQDADAVQKSYPQFWSDLGIN